MTEATTSVNVRRGVTDQMELLPVHAALRDLGAMTQQMRDQVSLFEDRLSPVLGPDMTEPTPAKPAVTGEPAAPHSEIERQVRELNAHLLQTYMRLQSLMDRCEV